MKAGISAHIVQSDRPRRGKLKVPPALSDKQEWATVGSRPLHATMISTAEAPSMSVDREFTFTTRDFARVRSLIYDRAGISLHEGKQAMVYSRLSRRLRDPGYSSFESYLQWLEQSPSQPEWQEFVDCLTTNPTSFFREEHHFHMLTAWPPAPGRLPTPPPPPPRPPPPGDPPFPARRAPRPAPGPPPPPAWGGGGGFPPSGLEP